MVKGTVTKEISEGICSFCELEIDKARMTQHLRHCKQRAVENAASMADETHEKTRLFHLLVEGRFNPQYWMHLELAAAEPLYTLDDFLRAIWLECCDHLSSFQIDGTHYDAEMPEYNFGSFDEEEESKEGENGEGLEEDEEEEGNEEVEKGKEEEDDEEAEYMVDGQKLLELLDGMELFKGDIPDDLRERLGKNQDLDGFIAFLRAELKEANRTRSSLHKLGDRDAIMKGYLRRSLLEYLLEELEDRTMNVRLKKVLKVGQKFTYTYDFGSSTKLNLRVLAEREGVLRDDDGSSVKILARNVPPPIFCKTCGQPATRIAAGFYYVGDNAYCNDCEPEELDFGYLPVVNSPRVGVCGYTGGEMLAEGLSAGEEVSEEEVGDGEF